MRNKKGVTLVSLIITIIVMLILASVGTYTGINSVTESMENSQKTELKLVQQAIIQRYIKYNSTGGTINLPGVSYTDSTTLSSIMLDIKLKTGVDITLKDTEAKNYYLLNKAALKELGIENTKDEYIVNYKTGEVINKTKLATKKEKEPLYTYAK